MAIINSAGIGKSRKSQGNLTYKYIRGRTIASSKIIENKSNTPAQASVRGQFALFSKFVQKCVPYIDGFYEKSKYGSARNAFMKSNKNLMGNTMISQIAQNLVAPGTGLYNLLSTDDKVIGNIAQGSLPGYAVLGPNDTTLTQCVSSIQWVFNQGYDFSKVRVKYIALNPSSGALTVNTVLVSNVEDTFAVGAATATVTWADSSKTAVSAIKFQSTATGSTSDEVYILAIEVDSKLSTISAALAVQNHL